MNNKLKKSSFIIFLMLIFVISGIFTSCSGKEEAPETEVQNLAELGEDQVVKLISGGQPEYVIVRGEMADEKEISAAVMLRKAINNYTDTDAAITTDWVKPGEEATIPAKEILVGTTTREESKKAAEELSDNSYIIKMDGDKLVILGATPLGTYKAVEAFISQKLMQYSEDSRDLLVSNTLSVTAEYDSNLPHTIVNFSSSLGGSIGGSEQDGVRLATCLQGLMNREFPETDMLVHQTLDGNDTFWLNYMMEDGNYFGDYEIVEIKTADEFWSFFLPYIKEYGIIAWDPAVPSTSNVASTICGVDGYLPVMYSENEGSLYQKLLSFGVEEKMSLVGKFTGSGTIPDTNIQSSGSAKCDAYLWALELYMDKCSTEIMGYVLDGAGCVPGTTTYEGAESTNAFYNQIYNHDYFVMNKAFCFDLTSNATEAPFDDPDQPKGTDYNTLCKILQAAYDRADGDFTQVVGFPPWWMKYTDFLGRGNMGGVDLEWQFAQLASTYNCAMEADCAHPCCMTNASLYCYYPLEEKYENNEPSEYLEYDKKTRYFTIYIGDYDASAWMKSVVPGFWSDPARGTIPLTWGFNPNLSNRIPMVFDYIYKNKSELDYFVTGDSGAGYINPSALINDNVNRTLPTASETWVKYNEPYLSRFDMDICGFVLNGAMKYVNEVFEMYSRITPVGSFSNNQMRLTIYNGTPMLSMSDYTTVENAYSQLKNKINFAVFRTVRISPTSVKEMAEEIENYANSKNDTFTYKYVGPYELFDLIRQSGLGKVIE